MKYYRLAGIILGVSFVSCSAEREVRRTAHGSHHVVEYEWSDLWGPCPKTHQRTVLLGPDGRQVYENVSGLSESPSGRWSIGTRAPDVHRCFAINHQTGEIVEVAQSSAWITGFRWSKKRDILLLEFLSFVSNKIARIVFDRGRPELETLYEKTQGSFEQLGWAPDESSIAFLDTFGSTWNEVRVELVQISPGPPAKELLRDKVEGHWLGLKIAWDAGRPRAVRTP